MIELNNELKRIEEGEAWDESDEVVQVEVNKPLRKTVYYGDNEQCEDCKWKHPDTCRMCRQEGRR